MIEEKSASGTETAAKATVEVQRLVRQVWFAPTARRHFFSKWAACVGEARARIKQKHPTEKEESENGYCISPGWSWHQLPRSEVLLKRYARKIMRSLPNADSTSLVFPDGSKLSWLDKNLIATLCRECGGAGLLPAVNHNGDDATEECNNCLGRGYLQRKK